MQQQIKDQEVTVVLARPSSPDTVQKPLQILLNLIYGRAHRTKTSGIYWFFYWFHFFHYFVKAWVFLSSIFVVCYLAIINGCIPLLHLNGLTFSKIWFSWIDLINFFVRILFRASTGSRCFARKYFESRKKSTFRVFPSGLREPRPFWNFFYFSIVHYHQRCHLNWFWELYLITIKKVTGLKLKNLESQIR